MGKLTDDMLDILQEKLKDPKVSAILHECLVEPLKNEIDKGELDAPVSNAIARISTPIIWVCVVMFALLITMLYCSIVLIMRAPVI